MTAAFPVVFALYPDITQLDFTGPYEVLTRVPGARCVLASIEGGNLDIHGDMALTVLAEIAGDDYAQTVQLSMEYAPMPPFDSGRPESARPQIVATARKRSDATKAQRDAAVRRAAAALAEAEPA